MAKKKNKANINKNNRLGELVRNARESSGLTISDFATMVNLSNRYIQKIENEGSVPRYDNLKKVIRSLAIDANALYYDNYDLDNVLVNQIYQKLKGCDEYQLQVINATLNALMKQ